jgi:hypothetical protein
MRISVAGQDALHVQPDYERRPGQPVAASPEAALRPRGMPAVRELSGRPHRRPAVDSGGSSARCCRLAQQRACPIGHNVVYDDEIRALMLAPIREGMVKGEARAAP